MTVDVDITVIASSNVASDEQQDPFYANTDNYIPPVYALDSYSITLGATLDFTDEETASDYSVIDVRVSGNTDLFTYTDNGVTINIQTGDNTPFDDYYEFLTLPPGDLPDDLGNANVEILDYNDAIDDGFVALVKWSEPDPDIVLKSHSFQVDVREESSNTINTYTISKNQNMYFDYRLMVDIISNLTDEGIY